MNVSYIDFWPGFNPGSNWFNALLTDVLDNKDIAFNAPPEEADVIISSTFGNTKEQYRNLKSKKIFYTGENIPPDLINADYSLSFDFDSHGGRNLRLPHWYLYIDWWNQSNCEYAEISQKQLSHKWDIDEAWNRPYFCSIIIGNPVQNRIEVANKLNEHKPVYGFGSVFKNPFSGSKVQLLENFKFNICFENTSFNGYITEKLLQAKVSGCVPLYYGHLSVRNDFNINSFINYNSFSSINDFYEQVTYIDTNKDLFSKIISEPLFKSPPNLDFLYKFLEEILIDK